MIKLVNENLLNVKTADVKSKTGKEFKVTTIGSSAKIVKSVENQDKVSKKVYHAPRSIVSVSSSDGNYAEGNIRVTSSKKNNFMELRAAVNPKAAFDTPLYIVAFPFNGVLRPFETSPQYRIMKGIVCHSCKHNLHLNGNNYNRVLYMAIAPNTQLFNEGHKYHVDEIKIPFTSLITIYDKNENDENTESKCVRESTMTVTIHSDLSVSTSWEAVDRSTDEVNIDDYKDTSLFTTYIAPAAPKKKPMKGGKRFEKKEGKPSGAGKGSYSTGYKRDAGDTERKSYRKPNAARDERFNRDKTGDRKQTSGKSLRRNNGGSRGYSNGQSGGSLDAMIKNAFKDSRSSDINKRMRKSGR